MGCERILDLLRPDILASSDDHVFQAVNDEQISIFIKVADVTCMHPAAAQGFGSLFRSVPIPMHDHGTARHDFAVLARRQLLVIRPDDRNFSEHCRPAGRTQAIGSTCFGGMVAPAKDGNHR